MPETIDKVLDSIHERYGVSTPISDFIYSSTAKALLSNSTTGGWVARETVDGRETDHLAFKDSGVEWELWVSATGDPLPVKGWATFSQDKRLRKADIAFNEGVAIVQRARVLRNMKDEAVPTGGDVKSGDVKSGDVKSGDVKK
jgi:hypothetical protein